MSSLPPPLHSNIVSREDHVTITQSRRTRPRFGICSLAFKQTLEQLKEKTLQF